MCLDYNWPDFTFETTIKGWPFLDCHSSHSNVTYSFLNMIQEKLSYTFLVFHNIPLWVLTDQTPHWSVWGGGGGWFNVLYLQFEFVAKLSSNRQIQLNLNGVSLIFGSSHPPPTRDSSYQVRIQQNLFSDIDRYTKMDPKTVITNLRSSYKS